MKRLLWVLCALSLSGLLGAGCKKSDSELPVQAGGPTVDIAKLQQAFAPASEEQTRLLGDVSFGLRYQDYAKSLMALDRLAASPGITEGQKKIVNERIEQVKKLAGAAPQPAQ